MASNLGEASPQEDTLTPDGKMIFVAKSGANTLSAIDAAPRKEVARIKVGQIPKRNLAVVLPSTNWV